MGWQEIVRHKAEKDFGTHHKQGSPSLGILALPGIGLGIHPVVLNSNSEIYTPLAVVLLPPAFEHLLGTACTRQLNPFCILQMNSKVRIKEHLLVDKNLIPRARMQSTRGNATLTAWAWLANVLSQSEGWFLQAEPSALPPIHTCMLGPKSTALVVGTLQERLSTPKDPLDLRLK